MEDGELFAQFLQQQFGTNTKLLTPQRGDNMRLVELANKNAFEEANRVTGKEERVSATLTLLGKMLNMTPPARIESFDISNISGTDIVASMVVFQDGKPKSSDYKRFKLEGMDGQDDYGAMRQVILRRFAHYKAGDKGFEAAPDLLLIDGGINHANVAVDALRELDLSFPVFGMVKDDRHRTRALVTPEGEEISISNQQAVFALIGNIQEHTHNFAIRYHRQLRSKRLHYSALDGIVGIGAKRKQLLLKTFKSLTNIGKASIEDLERILPRDAAAAVYGHFHSEGDA
jgi:excinuclease ABC subunit C